MKTYLVGGAVRDKLLSITVKDQDWVITGATPEQMQAKGFQAVGADFPVFLHPETKEEYALARTERKTGQGYNGFSCISDPSITIEQDLLRRDLTINAIAEDEQGKLIDPYGGQQDIQSRTLRHVSDAFIEDPLRVLRVARFAARFAHLGFSIADETLALMQTLSVSGELDHLTPERVFQEMDTALATQSPQVFFMVLHQCKALHVLFPEVEALFGVPQTATHHPEIDTGIHTLMVVEQASKLSQNNAVRFAALTHDLGKALTPQDNWPKHHSHENLGIKPVKALCKRLKVPNSYQQLAVNVCQFHLHCHRAFELKPATIAKLFKQLDAYRKPEQFEHFLLACKADALGRKGFENKNYPQVDYLQQAFSLCQHVKAADIGANIQGKEIGLAIEKLRIKKISQFKKSVNHE